METDKTKKTREQVYDFIVWYKGEYDGIAPSLFEIMEAVELKSKSPVHEHIESLIEEGRLQRHPHVKKQAARCLIVVGGKWSAGNARKEAPAELV